MLLKISYSCKGGAWEKAKKNNSYFSCHFLNPLRANPPKWSNTLKESVELFEYVGLFCGVGT